MALCDDFREQPRGATLRPTRRMFLIFASAFLGGARQWWSDGRAQSRAGVPRAYAVGPALVLPEEAWIVVAPASDGGVMRPSARERAGAEPETALRARAVHGHGRIGHARRR